MQIKSKKELDFYIKADRMMNRGVFCWSIKQKLLHLLFPDYIMSYLKAMRCVSYYRGLGGALSKIMFVLYYRKFQRLGMKLGFSIGCDTLGYGVVIPHWGTIVVGGSNRIGNYAVLHTSTCLTDDGKIIGDAVYISTGVKIVSKLKLGNGISIGANSLVNKSHDGDNAMLAGMPAKVIKDSETWYIRDHREDKVRKIEDLKKRLAI